MKRDRKGVLYIRDLDQQVKDSFKAWCAFHGTTMREKIEGLMKETIKEDMPNVPVRRVAQQA